MSQEIFVECIGARLRMLSRIVSRIYDQQLRPLGIKFSQMNILVLVTERGPIAPHQVAALLGFEKSTLSRNLRLLEARGWINSQPAESGHRLQLRITPAGRRLVAKAGPLWRKAQDEVVSMTGKRASDAIMRASVRAQQHEAIG